MSILAKPYPCAFGAMQYHAGLGGLILLNTSNWLNYQQTQLSTWKFASNSWSLLQTGLHNNPAPRTATSMAYDTVGGNMVQFGGQNVPGTELMNDTNLLSSAGVWSNLIPNYNKVGLSVATVQTTVNESTYPPTVVNTGTTNLGLNLRKNAMMAALSTGTFLFGGTDYNNLCYQQNWSYTNSSRTWSQIITTNYPTIRTGAAFASDGATNVVLTGGAATSWLLQDTWLYTSSSWTKLTTNTPPPARRNASMAWSPAASAFILAFGENSAGELLDDVWKLTISGTTGVWSQLNITNTAALQPARRSGAMMAYDTTSSQLIVFGGMGSGNTALFADTWQLTVSGLNASWLLLANAL
jgi:hypothetical protein